MKTPENKHKLRAQEMLKTIADVIGDEPPLISGFALVSCLQNLPIPYQVATIETLIEGLSTKGLAMLTVRLAAGEAAE